ncbi:hypothetical protein ABPG74_019608 [Tetrahymena malaccensis]
MIIKFITVNAILLLSSLINAKDKCVIIEGCLSCVENTNNQIQCTKCDIDYQLDTEKNICIYSKCSNYQFYDKNQYDGTEESGCVAICNTSSQQDEKINLCKSQQQCNTSKLSQQIIQENANLTDFFIYQNDYYVAQNKGSFFIYNRADASFIKNIKFLDQDVFVFQINSRIFIKGNDNSLSTWDIMNDFRKSILYQNLISFKSLKQINFIFNRYVIVQNIQQQQIEFQIFYDELDQAFSLSNSFTIKMNAKVAQLIDKYVFIQNLYYLQIYQIKVNYDEKNQLKLQLEFLFEQLQDEKFISFIAGAYTGIYYLAAERAVYEINITTNSYMMIANTNFINKIKLFQASGTSDSHYLIIKNDNQSLFLVNLQNHSQQLIINSLYLDFEICNLWGQQNQLIVLVNNLQLQFYELDESLQQFILSEQKYILNYEAVIINLIKYINQSSSMNQIMYEIAILSLQAIQIIKQGTLQQQERKLASVQIISNMKIPFPLTLLENNKNSGSERQILIYQYPPLIIQPFGVNQIIFYDLHENNNRFQKNIILLSDYVEKIDKFTANKIIALTRSQLITIDIFTKEVKQISWWYGNYLINYDRIMIFNEHRYMVCTSEMDRLFEQFIQIGKFVFFNYDQELQIYSQDFTLIYQKSKLPISNIESMDRIMNEDYSYLLKGKKEFVIIEIQQNTQTFLNITQISGKNYIDESVSIQYFVQLQYIKNPTNTKMIGFSGGKALIYTALFQNNKYYKLDLGDYKMEYYTRLQTHAQSGKYFIYNYNSIYQFDMFNDSQSQIVVKDIHLEAMYIYDKFLIYNDKGIVFINLFTNKKSIFQDMNIINGIIYDSQNNIYYVYGSKILILNNQLAITQIIIEENTDTNCYNCINFEKKVIFYCIINNQFSIVIIDKTYKKYQTFIPDSSQQFLFDEKYEHIYCSNQVQNIKIYSFQGVLKKVINENVMNCKICSQQKVICYLLELATFIDRQTLEYKMIDIRDGPGYMYIQFCIEKLNYLIFTNLKYQDTLSVYDISASKIVLSYSLIKQNSLNDTKIIDIIYDESSIRYFMYLDSEGTFYLSSIDPKLPFQSFVKINEFNDQQEQIQRFVYDGIANDVYISSNKSIYKLDYNLLGSQFEPLINYPQTLIAQISISGKETDYLIVNNNSTLLRYTQQQLKFELALSNDSRIVEIKYNQSTDTLIIGLEDSILFYQKYQQTKKDNIFPIFYKLQNVNLQQFITNYVQFTISPIDIQDNAIALKNDTFQNLGQETLKLLDFNFNFENNTNLFINITQNQFTKQIIIQNMTINLNSISSNQIYISNIEKVIFQDIKLSYLNLQESNQQNSLIFLYNVSQSYLYTHISGSKNIKYQEKTQALNTKKKEYNQMINKFITVNIILLLLNLINANDQCVLIEGCVSCIENTNNQIQCTKCDIDYQLDTEKNICIYSKCSNYQFYDKNQYDGTEESGCVAICNTSSQQDEKINLCKSQQQCNTSKLSQQIIQENANITDFFIYQNDYYVAQNQGSFFIYNRADASFIKNIKFLDQDVFVFQINSRIFIKGNDNSLSTWDIMNDFRKSILYQNLISFKSLKQINFIFNRYVIVQNIQIQYIEFQIFYDELDQAFSLSNSFTIEINAKVAQLIDKYVFIQNLYYLQIYQIKVNYDEKNQLNLQLEFLFEQFQDNKFISFIAGAYTGIYYFATERSVYELNITKNHYMLIGKIDFINKLKLFQASGTSDSHYLIIKNENDDQCLFLVNLQNNSQQLIINSLYLDFEICNLWGQQNQLIVLVNNLQLQFYELDESSQQFILSEQKYILSYRAVIINLIKYINQSSSMNQIMYEIAILGLQSIQIIKQGTLQQQERKLASVQIISNMKIPFPLTLLEKVNSYVFQRQILIYQYPPLIIQPFGVNQIIFYDLHENNNRFQKNIILLSDYVEKIDKFTTNKIIALTRNQLITIDIFTKEVKQISWWYGNYLINYDRIMIFYENRYIVYTSEMDRLFEQFIKIGKFVFFNYDQVIFFDDHKLCSLNLQNQEIQILFEIKEYVQNIQILKKFSSLQDQTNNKYSQDQILIYCNDQELQIYSQDFTLIYQKSKLPISNIESMDRIMNEDYSYLLKGNKEFVIIEIQQNTQTFLYYQQLKLQGQIIKKVNLNGKTYYSTYLSINNQLFEYFIDIQRNITQISGKNYIDESVQMNYFAQLQYIKNPTNTKMIGFQGDNPLIYTALFQNNKYYKLDLGDYKMNKYAFVKTHAQSGKYFIYNSNSIYQFDMFNDSQSQIVVKDIRLEGIDIYDKFLIYQDQGIVFINLFTNEKSIFQDMNIINGIIYDSQNNIYYVYGSQILILNNQLAITQIIIEDNTDTNCDICINFEKKVIFQCRINNQFSIVIIDKIYKNYQTLIPDQNTQQILIDEKYEHIYCYDEFVNIKIYSFQGILKKVINENVMGCYICSQQKVICYLMELATFIDRQTLEYKMIDIRDGPGNMLVKFCIEKLNYLIFTNLNYQDTLSVYDISASKIVLSYSVIKQNSLKDKSIIYSEYDENSIRYFMYLDSEGTFYLSSIDPKLPFQSFVKINEFNDQQEQIKRFVYDGIANDVYIISDKSIYKLDYNLLGSQFEPLINYPQTLIAQISISGKETDYLIVNNNSILLRYTQQQVKFELALSNDSRIVEIKYNQSTDTLIIGLEDSILFYQKYQQTKKDNIFPIFYKLQNVNLQQFITNYVMVATLTITIMLGYYIKLVSKYYPFISNNIQKCEISAFSLLILKIYIQFVQVQNPQIQRYTEIAQILIDYFFFFCYLMIVVGIMMINSTNKLVKQQIKQQQKLSLTKIDKKKPIQLKIDKKLPQVPYNASINNDNNFQVLSPIAADSQQRFI